MTGGGRRIATASGAILADEARLGGLLESVGEALFDPQFWAARGALTAVEAGRGAAWFIESASQRWVLRHYRRGGFITRLSRDRYLWGGEARVRAFAEYRLLARLAKGGLPVPRPIAARYERLGLSYRCDLITQRIDNAKSLSAMLAAHDVGPASWHAVGAAISRLHGCGVDHADLNAHNILLDSTGAVSLIDFDRSRVHSARGGWSARNLERLRHSLDKTSRNLPPDRFTAESWRHLLAGYESAADGRAGDADGRAGDADGRAG
jgi:3-deoxy-D-manno-octulosonic acid kinase